MISLLLIGRIHFVEEALLPDLRNLYVPTGIAPIVLAGGILLGYKVIRSGGNLLQVIVAGAILGLLPVMLDVVGFGMILGRGVALGLLAGVFGFSMVLFGSLIGGGFAVSR